jgi:hypothetical protein
MQLTARQGEFVRIAGWALPVSVALGAWPGSPAFAVRAQFHIIMAGGSLNLRSKLIIKNQHENYKNQQSHRNRVSFTSDFTFVNPIFAFDWCGGRWR